MGMGAIALNVKSFSNIKITYIQCRSEFRYPGDVIIFVIVRFRKAKNNIFLLHCCDWWKSSLNSLICLLTYSLTADMKSALLSKDILLSSCSTLYSKWLKFAFRLSNSSSIFLFMLVRNLEVSIVLQSWLLYDTWGSFLRTLCSSNWPMHSGCAPLSQLGHIVKFSWSSCLFSFYIISFLNTFSFMSFSYV